MCCAELCYSEHVLYMVVLTLSRVLKICLSATACVVYRVVVALSCVVQSCVSATMSCAEYIVSATVFLCRVVLAQICVVHVKSCVSGTMCCM